MARKRPPEKSPDAIPWAGAAVIHLPDGRTMSRAAGAPASTLNVEGHGRVILRSVTFSNSEGRTWNGAQWDLSELKIPPGAVPANPHLQTFCCSGPKLWYVDIQRRCVQCGEDFDFTAAEQRFWYETLSFHEASTAIRCKVCRKRRRTVKALGAQIGEALRATEAAPRDPDRWLELARVTGELRRLSGKGDINRGISAARKAWRLSQERLPEALYWEAVQQRAAGREDKARTLEAQFLALAGTDRRLRELARRLQAI